MRIIKILAASLALLVLATAAISYSWTFTAQGRLDYPAAVLAKVMSWTSADFSDLAAQRASGEKVMALATELSYGDPAPLAKIEDREVIAADGYAIPVRIYWPNPTSADTPQPMYLDIHGGGFIMGANFPMHAMITHFAARSQAIVVSVDYRLAPEHPYPTPLDDCYAVLKWMQDNAGELGGDAQRIAVGGGSAGGNLAAALTLRSRDEGGPPIAFQYLNQPAVDISMAYNWPSYEQAGDRYMHKISTMDALRENYAPKSLRTTNPYVSPILAEDLTGLPPALIVTSQFDPLRDQGEAYAERLKSAGVAVTLHREPGALHGFVGSPARLKKIEAMAAETLRRALAESR